ncbi:MAG: hypothetical protein AB8E15_11265 [Bdellovibrionales bacterium]
MSQFMDTVQIQLKRSSSSFGLVFIRLVSGLIYGLTMTLIFEQIFAYSNFAFWFVLCANLLIFMRVTKNWNFVGVLILNLFLVLLGMLLRMYVLVAPGA